MMKIIAKTDTIGSDAPLRVSALNNDVQATPAPRREVSRLYLVLAFLLLAVPATAQRLTQSINSNWLFRKDEAGLTAAQASATAAGWERISLPHTWNAADVLDDEPGYYRGVGWYRKALAVPADWQRRRVFLRFEGANQEAEVYVNGQLAGRHAGGYAAFSFPISQWLKFSGNEPATAEILVKLTNRYNPDIPPLTADFTFYGGIYRDVYLVAAEPVHFDLDNYASAGVFVSTPAVSVEAADVVVTGALVNESATNRKLTVISQLLDRAGLAVARQQTSLTLKPGQKQAFRQALPKLARPHLWTPDDPYLYRVVTAVREGKTGAPLDEVSSPVGLRWFRFDANEGFFLNGQHLKLIGTNRHQDFPGLGNALPDALAERDVLLLKQMGGNFLRVSHYPQDPAVLAACDRLGILASVEIPVVNAITDSPAFFQNCLTMQTEMIRQGYNHPSVIIWAYMNEVLLRLPTGLKRDNDAGRAYLGRVRALAQRLDSLSRREDPGRATMLVCHGDFGLYQQAGLLTIPQVLGWNLYAGWYSGDFSGFPAFLDRHHKELPSQPLLVTEYGADSDERLHALQPRRFDKTTEYANRYHEFYLRAMLERAFVAGSAVWNLAEFNSETRQEAVPHVNNKSLLTGDRRPKDAYLLYQAHLLKTPFLRIGSRAWTLRAGPAAGPDSLFCRQPVDVYTNQPAVRLLLNGRDLGTRPAAFGVARFSVPFGPGPNQLRAQAAGQPIEDLADIEFQLIPTNLSSAQLPFTELNVSLGDERFFTDEKLHQVWVPEQEYRPGGWGYVGGHPYKMAGDRLPYGSDRNILGTDYDAVYETQRLGLNQFRLDVPDGDYEITLHFAELETAPPAEQLAYNLAGSGSTPAAPTAQTRDFTVSVNGLAVLPNPSSVAALLPLQAVSYKVPVSVRDGQGIVIDFKARMGEAFLNGIQVKKVF
ncbi:glycoside hydrolase family 2 TIM barrel-domain containing protein [Hymenobacter sp. M29]|uniref:Glycoside hydrolase family 2 TIM barrel-domain containing protein n=1 Tax=Hymenobacter mellowenesis TaxID=3063995 RepID=A0ABT9A8R7_9BACT|nr:glycoside hydrolase family 2 TIM barrel-domain containing protein [Hymenobacter sp. M29]MDO7846239.1 glycoside hydrolase family 2 TIM barrel-domain containing protein [Hymenobacter sp. M29]